MGIEEGMEDLETRRITYEKGWTKISWIILG